ncbi:MAG: response regulator [Actinomycetota bacterium]|nr:response regulator [Actinomycetota bacterium]
MKVLVAAEARWVREQIRAALVAPGQEVIEVTRGQDVRAAVAEQEPDLVILDLFIGNMGGIAVAIDLHLEESAGRLPHVPILLLLDREADRFLAKRAGVEAELVKPVDPGTMRRTVRRLVGTETAAAAARPGQRSEPSEGADLE